MPLLDLAFDYVHREAVEVDVVICYTVCHIMI